MKRPSSVTSAIVVLFVFTAICGFSATDVLVRQGILRALPGLLLSCIHLILAFGLINRKNWARIFAISLFGLWSIGFVFIGIYGAVKHNWSGLVIEFVISVLLAWQFLALKRNEVKVYFSEEVLRSHSLMPNKSTRLREEDGQMRSTAKRPASVILAICILSILIVGSVNSLIHPYVPTRFVLKTGFVAQNRFPLVMLVVHIAALLSIILRRSWAGWLVAILFTLWGIFLGFPGFMVFPPVAIMLAISFLLLAYSLAFGAPSRKYFRPTMEPPPYEEGRPSQIISGLENDQAEAVSTWKCPRCGEESEGQFEACWNCGGTKKSE